MAGRHSLFLISSPDHAVKQGGRGPPQASVGVARWPTRTESRAEAPADKAEDASAVPTYWGQYYRGMR